MVKKIQVSFSDKQAELLEKFKGELGDSDADIVRNIVIAWLAEKSFITTIAKQRLVETYHSNNSETEQ
ncbi:hypothetical protein NKT77_06070 [Moraxella sp. FZLJ2107]|uniref:hypothetical protein n=1 Tax=unclassified Moraxella TaxID=2685852 RepID=UPI0020C926BF|nr:MULTISPECIES: hypothetical protein [unclassified Moraxella]UTO04106.1 hypothetical protein NKT77_06070 [Moraxella sp. FZLJ2107]UTO22939.1 hypothetical protein NKU06_02855 [Moraxella sp. FZLJ2109]